MLKVKRLKSQIYVKIIKVGPLCYSHPSYQSRFQMQQDSKILLNHPPLERPPFLQGHCFIVDEVALYKGDYYTDKSSANS
jgi:hypothetical protein